jgi:hypothetical protein
VDTGQLPGRSQIADAIKPSGARAHQSDVIAVQEDLVEFGDPFALGRDLTAQRARRVCEVAAWEAGSAALGSAHYSVTSSRTMLT